MRSEQVDPWQYDARDLATRPDLWPTFIQPPPLADWLDDDEFDCE